MRNSRFERGMERRAIGGVKGSLLVVLFLVTFTVGSTPDLALAFLPSRPRPEPLREYQSLTDEGRRKLYETEFGRYLAYIIAKANRAARPNQRYRYGANAYGAALAVPMGSYDGNGIVAVELQENFDENGTILYGYDHLIPGLPGRPHSSRGWNFEPIQVLFRKFDIVDSYVRSYDHQPPDPQHTQVHDTSCAVALRYELSNAQQSTGFRSLNERLGSGALCEFSVRTHASLGDPNAQMGPSVCASRAHENCPVDQYAFGDFWSNDGQLLLQAERDGSLTVIDPNGTATLFGMGHSPWEETFDGGPYYMVGEVFQTGQGALGWVDNLWYPTRSTDRNGLETVYGYNAGGFLETITDPRGRTVRYERGDYNGRPGVGALQRIVAPGPGGSDLAYELEWELRAWDPFVFEGECQPVWWDPRVCRDKEAFTTLKSLRLPDGRYFRFEYGRWGNLTRADFPDGAVRVYEYASMTEPVFTLPPPGYWDAPGFNSPAADFDRHRLISETVYPNGTGLPGFTTQYEHYLIRDDLGYDHHFRHTVYPDGSVLRTEVAGGPAGCENFLSGPLLEERWQSGSGFQPIAGLGSWQGENLLEARTYHYLYERPASLEGFTLNCDDPLLLDQRVQRIDLLLDGVTWSETFGYDVHPKSSLRTFGNGTHHVVADGQGRVLAETETQYVRDSAYLEQNLIRLPLETLVSDGLGRVFSRTTYRYDEFSLEPSGAKNLDPSVGTDRGNLTTTTRFVSAELASGEVVTQARYYDTGDIFQVTDPEENTTTTQYNFGVCSSDNLQLETIVTSPPPDPDSNPHFHVTQTIKDCYTGSELGRTDANGQTTSTRYDTLGRKTEEIRPDGGRTTIEYGDQAGNLYARTQVSQDRAIKEETYTLYDGLHRIWRTSQKADSGNWSVIDTEYDEMGRIWRVSTPYFTTGVLGSINPSGQWTTNEYDFLGRVISVTTPDGAQVHTGYSGSKTTVTDPAGEQRTVVTDVLGRTIQVVEDPNGLAYVTNYTYDVLGNLRIVEQGAQRRYFVYDSLSRLVRAKNPEQDDNPAIDLLDPFTGNSRWSAAYGYDKNGNLIQREDARGIETRFSYDNLNRLTSVTYNDGKTHKVERHYDGAAKGKGLLWYHMTIDPTKGNAPVAKTTIDSYDPLGRVTSQRQQFWTSGAWKDYAVKQTYNLGGGVMSKEYPSGHQLGYAYDQQGRSNLMMGTLGDGQDRTYADEIRYTAGGLLARERFRTDIPLYHNRHYNNRQQLQEVRLGTDGRDEWTWNRGGLRIYHTSDFAYYGTGSDDSGVENNGTVYRMDHFVPLDPWGSGWAMSIDYYGYDPLNRITGVWEHRISSADLTESEVFTQQYVYDRYGNRTINAEATTPGGLVNNKAYRVDEARNRLIPLTGTLGYDAMGNVVRDSTVAGVTKRIRKGRKVLLASGERTYDGENRLTEAADVTGFGSYVYDGDGRRVKRVVNGQEWWMIYGIDGELSAEYLANTSPGAPQKEYGYRNRELLVIAERANLQWLVPDHLGTPRMVVNGTGSLEGVSRHDYLPFGEEIGTGVGIRNAATGYGPGTLRQKFTGKERDDETGLDWFGPGRYYSSLQGRFVSTDPLNIPALRRLDPKKFQAIIVEPHHWNGYAYAHNSPLSKLDPDGFLTLIIPGTWHDWKKWNSSDFRILVSNTFGEQAIVFKWSGGDNKGARSQAAADLNKFINEYMKDHPGEKINIVAHSHGGNVVFEASRTSQHRFDTVVTLGTPVRDDYKPNHHMISFHLNVYSEHDRVQVKGGQLPYNPLLAGLGTLYGEFGPAGRTIEHPMVYNLDASHHAKSHSELWTNLNTWVYVVEPSLKK
jgi:RHS repeat-associated protein